jgi:hypothetical protein
MVYYPCELFYGQRENLIIFKNSNWCFSFFSKNNNEMKDIINNYFGIWDIFHLIN